MKLSWHPGSQVHCKEIGKQIAKDGKRLVAKTHYFSADPNASAIAAAAIKAQWVHLKKTWDRDHAPALIALDEPFATIPHWYKSRSVAGRGSAVTDANVKAMVDTRDDVTTDEMSFEHADMTLHEVLAKYIAHQRKREGVDFKPTTNKSAESNLNGVMRFVDGSTIAATFTPAMVDAMRIKMLKSELEKRTVRNFGSNFKAMMVWYWKSSWFKGGIQLGIQLGNFDAEFAKFPKLRNAKPVHLPMDTMKAIFDEATTVRRMYLLLMLNTGMQATDIATVEAKGFDLATGKVTWKREKLQRLDDPSDVEVVSTLWPETIAAIKPYLAKSGLAFRNQKGKPLAKVTAGRYRMNAVAKGLAKLFERLAKKGIKATAKNFRQTGAQMILEAGSYDLSEIWLGRGFKMVDRSYVVQTYHKLDAAADAVRQKLITAGVL
jgi:hypothetical protein